MEKFTPYEPKKNNRFLVEFPEQFDIKYWVVKKINNPKYTNGEWENIKIEFNDPIDPSTSKGLYSIINFLKINYGNDNKIFEIKIKLLDPIGDEVEVWVISGAILTINFGELDYSDNNILQPYLIFKPLNCILN